MKLFFISFWLIASTLTATDTPKNLRILELLPNLTSPLAVDPSIPPDFIALSSDGILSPADWIFWGPKDTLEAYFKNPASLNSPILSVKLGDVIQTGPNSFDERSMESLKMLRKMAPDGFASFKTSWGIYPVLVTEVKVKDQGIFMASVGLNDPNGLTLLFTLIYPRHEGRPNNKDLALWANLIMKTKQLTNADFFKANGQDLQQGYTLLNVGGAKLKMLAEKRLSDGTIQVVVIPEADNVKFVYANMEECLMGAKWKYGEPMVKVHGDIILRNKGSSTIAQYITSIFFNTVPEFTYKKDEINEKDHLVFQKKS